MPIFNYNFNEKYKPRSRFGYRDFNGETKHHDGIDESAINGTPIRAAETGRVVYAGPSDGYGNAIVLEYRTENGKYFNSIYGHMDEVDKYFKPGDVVLKGQQIAGVGNKGISTGPHLHLGVAQNPDSQDGRFDSLKQPRTTGGLGFKERSEAEIASGMQRRYRDPDNFEYAPVIMPGSHMSSERYSEHFDPNREPNPYNFESKQPNSSYDAMIPQVGNPRWTTPQTSAESTPAGGITSEDAQNEDIRARLGRIIDNLGPEHRSQLYELAVARGDTAQQQFWAGTSGQTSATETGWGGQPDSADRETPAGNFGVSGNRFSFQFNRPSVTEFPVQTKWGEVSQEDYPDSSKAWDRLFSRSDNEGIRLRNAVTSIEAPRFADAFADWSDQSQY